jgi:hypothetical protein
MPHISQSEPKNGSLEAALASILELSIEEEARFSHPLALVGFRDCLLGRGISFLATDGDTAIELLGYSTGILSHTRRTSLSASAHAVGYTNRKVEQDRIGKFTTESLPNHYVVLYYLDPSSPVRPLNGVPARLCSGWRQ